MLVLDTLSPSSPHIGKEAITNTMIGEHGRKIEQPARVAAAEQRLVKGAICLFCIHKFVMFVICNLGDACIGQPDLLAPCIVNLCQGFTQSKWLKNTAQFINFLCVAKGEWRNLYPTLWRHGE